jgi:uncharacterized protein YndB with AHSA1/START domain
MQTEEKIKITVQTTIEAPIEKVWKCFTSPEDIVQWNTASADWHTTHAENDLHIGGKFNSRMEAKDGSFGFDFWGIYNEIILHEKLASTLGDGRTMEVKFISRDNATEVIETFEAENENPVELQRGGWQAILDNLKKHVEK